jgi:hypothetical protein
MGLLQRVDVKVQWVPGFRPRREERNRFTYDHQAVAAELRSRPGVWARLDGMPADAARSIVAGQLAPYRPSGSFTAIVQDGVVYASYIGGAQ